ncbi:SRPBCC family protein [Flavisolibacter ginsenosidimutans]|uniref:SRPBCC domain-containing protein n=1 Tax=Flavisolibacter ginsenosidimutans TaxID=661481 RepID=A0A5B8UFC9_9BACT|nr:SRPBCC domain-containing protein [Flavisolibacter ginsenosidimutans]QEC55371.1 SRPBCC domain-containing protein [Flavisolibacter ginsenosidimutans]
MKQEPLVVEQRYNAPAERIWQALTNKEQMKQWYFDIAEFEPKAGFEFTFNGENEGTVFVHQCKITEVVPNKKLKHSWAYKDYEGLSFVTFELFNEGESTRLKLTHEGLESFPQTKDFKRENFKEGWTYILGTSLNNFLAQEKAQ